MAIVSIPADLSKGADPSPWTVNGNDLYPDSTSYLVGIGTTNPDTLLHIKATDGTPKIKLEGTGYDYTIEVDANHGATQDSSLFRIESDSYWASAQVELLNGSTLTTSSMELYLSAKSNSSIIFRDTDDNRVRAKILAHYDNERMYIYGEDGYAGGMFTMDWSQANDARFGVGYGDQALSNASRLAIKHTSSPQLLLDDGEASNNNPITLTNATGTGLTFTTTNGDGSGNSALSYKFVNDRASGGTSTIHVIGDTATGLYLTSGSQGLKIDQNTANRRVRFRDYGAGNAGGCFNMEYNDSGSGTAQNFFSFGYGDEAHPYDARLNIKDAALPQLALTDGTNTTNFTTDANGLTLGHSNAGAWVFSLDSATNTNIDFLVSGSRKATIRHFSDAGTNGLLGMNVGMWRLKQTSGSVATQNVSSVNGYGNVLACDTTGLGGSTPMNVTLPAVADYAGTVIYVIDSKGNAASNNIVIGVQTGEKLDGVLNGTGTISANHGFAMLISTTDGWFTVSN